MKIIKFLSLALALTFFVSASAQVFDSNLFEPLGDVTVGDYGVYDVADSGRIILSATTPTDQEPNYDVVGPNNYYERFDISDNPGDERGLENLLPGVYSIAASDEGLQLSATLVEVRAGETVPVNFNLQPMDTAAYDIADYSPYAYGYSADYNTLGTYTPYDNPDLGSVVVTADIPGTEVIVTGPNGYSENFETQATLDDLPPGTYVVAATGQGYDTSRNVFEVRAGERLETTTSVAATTAQ